MGSAEGDQSSYVKDELFSEPKEMALEHSTIVFALWAYLVGAVSLLTLFVVCFSPIFVDPQAEHFSMPPLVRQHLSKGKLLKIEFGRARQPIKVFVREEASPDNRGIPEEHVVLLHGLATSSFMYANLLPHITALGYRVITMDFPGAGFSDKPLDRDGGFWDRVTAIFQEISEKGIFWRFEQLFDAGSFSGEHPTLVTYEHRKQKYDAEDLADSLDQVLNLVVEKPVHIVLHDTSVQLGLLWIAQNPTKVGSITIFDAFPSKPSFPIGMLRVPLLGKLVARSTFLHHILLRACCTRSIGYDVSDSHAFLLQKNGGREAVLRTWEGTNTSFDVAAYLKDLQGIPVHILWSRNAGIQWQEIGETLAVVVGNATTSSHNGSRWPQEDTCSEIAKHIHQFISSLPPTMRNTPFEPIPQHIQEMFKKNSMDEVEDFFHGQNHHTCDHGHGEANHFHQHRYSDPGHEHHVHDHGRGLMNGMGPGGWVL